MRSQIAAVLFGVFLGGCVAEAGVGYQAQVVTPAPVVVAPAPEPAATVEVQADVQPVAEEPVADEGPELITVEAAPTVQVVYNAEEPIFFNEGFYWRFYNGGWYRSSVHTGGWVVYNDVPVAIRHIDRPVQYSHYRPSTYTPRAQRPDYHPRPVHTTTAPVHGTTYTPPRTTGTTYQPQPHPTGTTYQPPRTGGTTYQPQPHPTTTNPTWQPPPRTGGTGTTYQPPATHPTGTYQPPVRQPAPTTTYQPPARQPAPTTTYQPRPTAPTPPPRQTGTTYQQPPRAPAPVAHPAPAPAKTPPAKDPYKKK